MTRAGPVSPAQESRSGFWRQARVVIVIGKGGVGKTTVSAALARAASLAGMDALVVEIEGKGGLTSAFEHPDDLDYREVVLYAGDKSKGEGDVRGRTLRADEALIEYLEDHAMGRLSKRLLSAGAIDVVATAVPGIKDILVLGKVKQLEREHPADLIVLDAPASGHAISFLAGAGSLLDAVRSGPIRAQAQDVVNLLTDESRCQVLVVTLAEEMPVNEAAEVAAAVEDRVGAHLGPVVVNGVYPRRESLPLGVSADALAAEASIHLRPGEAEALDDAAQARRGRQHLQESHLERLSRLLPLPQVVLPFLFTASVGRAELEELARAMSAALETID
ncbi:MAG TPA: ArsA-related P-loop ATPase [Acidimicrobiales bacterium]|nr:ArsA-related P-loop ATPase [Acidimicrobiales bacterium]